MPTREDVALAALVQLIAARVPGTPRVLVALAFEFGDAWQLAVKRDQEELYPVAVAPAHAGGPGRKRCIDGFTKHSWGAGDTCVRCSYRNKELAGRMRSYRRAVLE
jgi:hypothetical protein